MAAISTLTDLPRGESSVVDWYMSTGGLRRRLRLLARLARALAEIHGMGLAYGDPSPGNVLISETPDSDDVFLIDCDNLRYSTNPEEVKLYTPGYGAPELVSSRSGFNTLTDAHAFAVIAFRLLCLTHPLIGDSVANGDPGLEEAAYRGELPWIEHATDDSNRSSLGVDRAMVLSKNLRRLLSITFGEGLSDPTKRPGMAHWVEVLQTAAAVTINCSGCDWSYYYASRACPICDRKRPDVLIGWIGLWDPALGESGAICTGPGGRPMWVDRAVGTSREPLLMSESQLGIGETEESVLAVKLKHDRRITLSNPSGNEKILVTGSRSGAAPRPIAGESESFHLSRPDSILFVHIGELSGRHRVVCLELSQEEDQ
jgi:serine/threonine protein kinase